MWDSLVRMPDVHRLEKLPDNAQPATEKEKRELAELAEVAAPLAKGDFASLKKALRSPKALERQAALTCAGAIENLPLLVETLSASPDADARDHAVLVVRNWLGRRPGQTVKLAEFQEKTKGLTPAQARSGMQLLLGFEPEKHRDPDLYSTLIVYLNHSRPPVRHLAHWHLVRLAPAGRDIPYDALAPEAEREKAQARWRELIPEGKLPPPPKK
jgi:hypothetical protein